MAKIRVEFEILLPAVNCDPDEVEEWIRYELQDNGSMCDDNPLSGFGSEPIFGTFKWEYC